MPKKQNNLYQKWFAKADEDDLSASFILKEQHGSPSTVCFLSQQIAEKYLKGLLVFADRSFPKIHDLVAIATTIEVFLPSMKEVKEDLTFLNGYYVQTRYPGDFPEFHWGDAKDAYKAAQNVKQWVLKEISKDSMNS
ncbi:MAG: HEPN domain-containing protein [bacterium]|nr:HEPN domain-containing protein [bacterium]